VGLLDWTGWGRAAALTQALPSLPGLLAPQIEAWTTGQLEGLVWSDILGGEPLPVTRAEAMAVPAVARARHLTAGAVARCPLQALRYDVPVPEQPGWMHATDGQLGDLAPDRRRTLAVTTGQSPWWRMLWTIDDQLFYGYSVWLVTRPDPEDGRPQRMVRLPWATWSTNEAGEIVDMDGHPFPASAVRVLPGPHEGILTFGAGTIRSATRLERTAADIAARPFRLELHQTTDIELTPAERSAMVAQTREALANHNGILFTNAAIETKDHKLDSADLLIAGRNAAALDIARDVSMPGAMIDATTEGASLEYQTTQTRNQQWLDYGLSLYLDAVASRLSMDDCVPSGQRVAFDTNPLTAVTVPSTGTPLED
jgi:hypothetical protein